MQSVWAFDLTLGAMSIAPAVESLSLRLSAIVAARTATVGVGTSTAVKAASEAWKAQPQGASLREKVVGTISVLAAPTVVKVVKALKTAFGKKQRRIGR
jgi:hypothetical protein